MSLRRNAALALLCALLASCEEGTTGPPPVNYLLPMADGTWFVNTVNSDALPAKISERFVGAAFEEIFLDSARLEISNLAATYEQRYWTRVHVNGILDRNEFVFDEGTFGLGSGAFVFNSSVRSRTFTASTPSETEIRSTEAMAFHAEATPITGSYRRTRP